MPTSKERVEAAMQRCLAARSGLQAQPPAGEAERAWLRATIGDGPAATALHAVYAAHDGATEAQALVYDYEWSPLGVAKAHHERLGQGATVLDDTVFFRPSWFPLLSNGGGSYLCVDCDDPEGRILELEYGEIPRLYLPSFEALWTLAAEPASVDDDHDGYWGLFQRLNPGFPKKL